MIIMLSVIMVVSCAVIACGAAPESVVRSDSVKVGAASTKASAMAAAERPLTALDSVIAAAESSYWEGEYAVARSTWTTALDQARKRADKRAQAEVLTWLGLAAWRLGDYGEARQAGEAALKIKIDEGLRTDLSRSYNALGLLAWNESRLADAAQLFQRATATAEAVGDEEGSAKALGNQALVLTELGDFAGARNGFAAARAAGSRLRNSRVEANAITNLAMLDLRAGSPLSAVSLLEQALQIYKSIEYATGEQTALAQLGAAYGALGEPARAFAALDSALASARRQGLKQDEAANLELIAS